jgi:hypothetical protein
MARGQRQEQIQSRAVVINGREALRADLPYEAIRQAIEERKRPTAEVGKEKTDGSTT